MTFTQDNAVGAVLVLITVVLLFSFAPQLLNIAEASAGVEKCRLETILATTQIGRGVHLWDMQVFRLDVPNPFIVDCPKRYGYLREESFQVDKVSTDFSKDGGERRRQINDFILGELSRCWRSYGDASDKVYTASPETGAGDIDTEETACFACSEIFVESGFERTEIKLEDFYGHADSQTRIDGRSYVEFLTKAESPKKLPDFGENEMIVLEEGQQWTTVFTIKKVLTGFWDTADNWIPFETDEFIPPANAAIIGCFVLDEQGSPVNLDERMEIALGCKDHEVGGFSFGKVAEGFTTLNLVDIDKETHRFPMTVRFMPTKDIIKECKRLY
ncbi:hypothetical protein HYX10_05510 [Candidatus Woesearchaeota archaeon]|nr:hypothetical protein [Candidatus Woesearchaeota archaeon]